MTAQEAIDTVRSQGADLVESILYLYVVDDQRRLRGVVPIRRLVSAPPSRALGLSCGYFMTSDLPRS